MDKEVIRERKSEELWEMRDKWSNQPWKNNWLVEIPKIIIELSELSEKRIKLEKQLPQDILAKIKLVNNRIAFLQSRLKAHEKIK